MRTFLFSCLLAFIIMVFSNCSSKLSEENFKKLVDDFSTKYSELEYKANLSEWNAMTSGDPEEYKKLEIAKNDITSFLKNKELFDKVKEYRENFKFSDMILKRECDVLYRMLLPYQFDEELSKEISKLEVKITKEFSSYRAKVDDKVLSDNDVLEVLNKSSNSDYRKKVWLAQKNLGNIVAQDIKKVAKLRNRLAQKAGFKNFFDMKLTLGEFDKDSLDKIFNYLDENTKESFSRLKDDIDTFLAKKFKVDKSKLMPWHYNDLFFQRAPEIYKVDFDNFYKNQDIVKIAKTFYEKMNMDVDSILARSDLYEKKGKNQHAFSMCLDRKQDIRILVNLKPNAEWMGTLLHELGHSVYDEYIDQKLPFLLRTPSHAITTEATAMTFERNAINPYFINDNVEKISSRDKLKELFKVSVNKMKAEKLIFTRWALVMYNFEKMFYENPDQDCNSLWWSLVTKYQLLNKPDTLAGNEWATKIHIATVPVYYHNYMVGELMVSQVLDFISKKYLNNKDIFSIVFYETPQISDFFKNKIFKPGNTVSWNELIKQATGEYLNPQYFVNQYKY